MELSTAGRAALKRKHEGYYIFVQNQGGSRLELFIANGSVIDERNYEHDSVGNISSIAITAGTTTSYTYDPVYRLLNVDSQS